LSVFCDFFSVLVELSNQWVWYPDDRLVWGRGLVLSSHYVENTKGPGFKECLISISDSSPPVVKRIRADKVHRVDPTHLHDLDNLCLMNDMHEAPLLDLLRRRFSQKIIYTYTGDVLISINPYETIAGLYEDRLKHFSLHPKEIPADLQHINDAHVHLKPHVYQIANKALSSLVYGSTELNESSPEDSKATYHNQSVIISGESGAGKTENSKHVINFLIEANNFLSHQTLSSGVSGSSPKEEKFAEYLKGILIESSVVLEAFGNAKTLRNDNSSRFGKYIKLMYSSVSSSYEDHHEIPKLYSAIIETFLLEKSRLAFIGQGERSYHVFYQLFSGITSQHPALAEQLSLNFPIDSFRMISQGACFTNEDDNQEFRNTVKALEILQCSETEILEIWKILATVLHLGNLECVSPSEAEKEDSQSKSASILNNSSTTSQLVHVKSPTISLDAIASHLGVGIEQMITSLTTQQLTIMRRSSIKVKILTPSEVSNNVFALIKWLYSKLFDWIVMKINYLFSSQSQNAKEQLDFKNGFIGILDIFGFEILANNSFEQLCINFTNERLQQQFNEFVFVTEQTMYRKEGLEWSNITFQDNQSVIDLISSTKKPLGLLLVLEEQGMLNRKPDDLALLAAFNQMHEVKDAKGRVVEGNIYSKSRFGNTSFNIKHFAGDVSYNIEGFLMKNNDSLQDDLVSLLNTSKNIFLRNVMRFADVLQDPNSLGFIPVSTIAAVPAVPVPAPVVVSTEPVPVSTTAPPDSASTQTSRPASVGARGGGAGKKMASSASVSMHFRQQLDTLMLTLTSTSPNYIKCVKPNALKSKENFDPNLVNQQLRYSGVLEVVRIRREGFPVRMTFLQFYKDYEILARGKPVALFPGSDKADFEQAKKCTEIIAKESLPRDAFQIGTSLLFLRQNGLNLMQDAIRNFYGLKAAAIQSKFRCVSAKKNYVKTYSQVIILQSIFRMAKHRKTFLRIKNACSTIKYFYISKRLRKQFIVRYQQIVAERRLKSTIKIQTFFRAARQRKLFKILYFNYVRQRYKSALTIQCSHRIHLAKKHYQLLKKIAVQIKCALTIQCMFRIRLAKKHYQLLKKIASIIRVQSWFRSCSAQSRFQFQLCVITAIQSYLRKFHYRQLYLRKRQRVIRLQAMVRRHLTKQKYENKIRPSIIKIQAHMRKFLSVRHRLIALASITCIQNNIRRRIAVKDYQKRRHSIILIQSEIRSYIARRRFVRQYVRVIRLQIVIRRFLARRLVKRRLRALIKLQSFGRMINERRSYNICLISLIMVQNSVRKYLCYSNYQKKRKQIALVQSLVRRSKMKKLVQKMLRSIVKLQSFGRMLNAVRTYNEDYISIVITQSMVRKHLAKKQASRLLLRVVLIQSCARKFLNTLTYKYQRRCVTKLQSFGRMINQRTRFNEIMISVIIVQTVVRGLLCKSHYRKARAQIIQLQSWYRMQLTRTQYYDALYKIVRLQATARRYIAHLNYQIHLVSILVMQAAVRRGICRNTYLYKKVVAVLVQSHYRKHLARKNLAIAKYAETVISKNYRARFYRKRFLFQMAAINRVKQAVRRFLLNFNLCKRIHSLHEVCHGDHSNSDKNSQLTIMTASLTSQKGQQPQKIDYLSTEVGKKIARHLHSYPEDRLIRYYYDHSLKTLFQSLVGSGDDEIMKFLRFSCSDCFEADATGKIASHYLALDPSIKMLTYLFNCINTLALKSNAIQMDAFDEDNDNDDNNEESGGRFSQIKQALQTSVGSSSLKAGWLKKKRGGMMWQKRWVVLTEEYIIYYSSPQTTNNPKFAIPLEGCTVQRLPGSRDPIFELIAPNMTEKKSYFGSSTKKSLTFLCDSEKDLQEWLLPLKAVAGVGTFRSTPVRYINTDLRKLWLTKEAAGKETPLHCLIKSKRVQNSGLVRGNNASNDLFIEEVVVIIAWFVEFGCPVNQPNIHGDAPLFVAVSSNVDSRIVRALIIKGADPRLTNSSGVSSIDLITSSEEKRKLYQSMLHSLSTVKMKHTGPVTSMNNPINPVLDRNYSNVGKLKGYSHLSIFFGMQTFNGM
jgi:myosin heavy subunit